MSPIYVPGKVVLAKQFTWNQSVWNPSMISTALWLDAADASTVTTVSGVVSEWRDKSGKNRHFTQETAANRPAYSATGFNGLPSITFDGTNDSIQFASKLATADTWVLLLTQFAVTGVAHVPFCSSTSGSSVNDINNVRFLTIGTRAGFGGIGGAGDSFVDPYASNVPYIFNWSQAVNGNLRTNGVTVSTGTPDKDAAATVSNTTQLGTDGYGNFHKGNLQEIIIAPSTPSLQIIEKIEGYIAHKWGLTASLPADHPYRNVGPTP